MGLFSVCVASTSRCTSCACNYLQGKREWPGRVQSSCQGRSQAVHGSLLVPVEEHGVPVTGFRSPSPGLSPARPAEWQVTVAKHAFHPQSVPQTQVGTVHRLHVANGSSF